MISFQRETKAYPWLQIAWHWFLYYYYNKKVDSDYAIESCSGVELFWSDTFSVTEEPIECPEGEQPAAGGLSCEPITVEEPIPIECGEGEELIDGQCQAIPTEEILTEEPEEEPPEAQEDEGDTGGDEGEGVDGDEGESGDEEGEEEGSEEGGEGGQWVL